MTKPKYVKTQEYKTWDSVIAKITEFPTSEHLEKVESIHSGRNVRKLKIRKADALALTSVSMQETGARSDLVELLLDTKKSVLLVEHG